MKVVSDSQISHLSMLKINRFQKTKIFANTARHNLLHIIGMSRTNFFKKSLIQCMCVSDMDGQHRSYRRHFLISRFIMHTQPCVQMLQDYSVKFAYSFKKQIYNLIRLQLYLSTWNSLFQSITQVTMLFKTFYYLKSHLEVKQDKIWLKKKKNDKAHLE